MLSSPEWIQEIHLLLLHLQHKHLTKYSSFIFVSLVCNVIDILADLTSHHPLIHWKYSPLETMFQERQTSVCFELSPSCNAGAMCGPEHTPLWYKIPPEKQLRIYQPTHLHPHPSLIFPTTQPSSRRGMKFLLENVIAMGTSALKFWQHSMKSSFYLFETFPNWLSGYGSSTGQGYLQCLKKKVENFTRSQYVEKHRNPTIFGWEGGSIVYWGHWMVHKRVSVKDRV